MHLGRLPRTGCPLSEENALGLRSVASAWEGGAGAGKQRAPSKRRGALTRGAWTTHGGVQV